MAAVERLVCSVPNVEAILRLAARFPVFPCRRNQEEVIVRGERKILKPKSPLTGNGLHDATQKPEQIRAWWSRWPDALVGVPTGNATRLIVIDYDSYKADESANAWILENTESLLSTRTHTTLNGGRHYLFKAPEGIEYRNGVCLTLGGTKRNGIDLRAEGGYIIWWPMHGGATLGDVAALPVGLIDQQKIIAVDLAPLPKATPEKWSRDRDLISAALAYLDPGDYGVWSMVGMALHLASSGSTDGFDLWHAWSSGGITGDLPASYSGMNDCRYHWDSYRHDKARAKLVTLGSVFEAAKKAGYVMPRKPTADDGFYISHAEPKYDHDPDESLLDFSSLDGAQILAEHMARFGKYDTTPFDVEGDRLRLYPGGVTVWSGFPGAGKTTLLRQLACQCLKNGSGVFYASLEEDPRSVLINLAAVAVGKEMPTAKHMQWFIDWYADSLRLWGKIGLANHRELLAVVRKVADQGVKHAVIDSLMCLDVPNDDFEAQRKFANLVAATARAANIHIHLVAHPRKLVSADQEPDINDVGGAREIGGIADNVIFVRRSQTENINPTSPVTPMCVSIRKQRHWRGTLGNVTGWFHRDFKQFTMDQFKNYPTQYLPKQAYE